ncbi:NAD(P)H-dependent glycerol-3-phosphate dehydrogenase [Deinococcus aquiradiocola]|uniref:Glycerol-3-phosphate dehydrogenase [NAD(P)+] n=1 Tax=Deinococcus aquiradiocola TaxID=393059 RepID=A0A917PJV3_9DEIO|nr:NAD(P)H-dependent glycerol-3-phosphate dehydrogenase [Deinococcus aquiradiocola]GGJ81517.1 glycerol-3-phosphate dehydrogenase [NAD(P)+] [Deinococcus aquiradiocola]
MNTAPDTPVPVLGAGGWGTALAATLARHGRPSTLWARREEVARTLAQDRENRDYLPGVPLPQAVHVTADLHAAVHGRDWALLTVPSVGIPDLLHALPRDLGVVLCAKGLAPDGDRLSLLAGRLGFTRVAVLSGPNHAEEIGRGLPAATVVASSDPTLSATVQDALMTPALRVYTSRDLSGVELGGVLKNVIALAAGLIDGLELGDNAKAALITRGLREMGQYLASQGAEEGTVYGLSGLGDLVATAGSRHSRNRAAGEAIGRGQSASQGGKVVEGVRTAGLLSAWAEAHGQDLPIVRAVARVVSGEWTPRQGVQELMGRQARSE